MFAAREFDADVGIADRLAELDLAAADFDELSRPVKHILVL